MIQAIQMILALSFLVVIHELGHFTFARIFKVRVEKFYVFFNPKISLLRAKKINGKWQIRFFAPNVEPAAVPYLDEVTKEPKIDKKGNTIYRPMTDEELQALPKDDWRRYPDNTEWGIGWIPFGGYCSIAGMIDETKSAADLPSEPQPWEFRSKNVFQRLCIIIGGILVNFVAAICIFGLLIFHWGTDELPLENAKQGFYYSELMQQQGFRQQDRILMIDSVAPESLGDVVNSLIIEGKRNVTVLRGKDTLRLTMSKSLGTDYLAIMNETDRIEREKARKDKSYEKRNYVLISYFYPSIVDTVMSNGAAYYAGIAKGDSIVSIDSVMTPSFIQMGIELRKHPCDSITVGYYREGEYMEAKMFIGDKCKMGIAVRGLNDYVELKHTDYSFWEAIPAGIQQGMDILKSYVKQFRLVFTKEGAQSLGGFGAIGKMFPKDWSWFSFWYMTAFLSLILAFMNFLPIPALDGGYILFLLFEMITRKQPNDKFLEIANNIGFWLLLVLLIFANGNDLFKAFF